MKQVHVWGFLFSFILSSGAGCVEHGSRDAGGSGCMQLTASGYDRSPVCSPDGRSIVFQTARRTYKPGASAYSTELWIMDSDGTRERCLLSRADPDLSASGEIGGISWFPDSASLLVAVGSWNPGGSSVWRVYVDGRKERISLRRDYAQWPTCSSDGKRIAYAIQGPNPPHGSPVYRLYSANPDGTDRVLLAKGCMDGYVWCGKTEGIVYALLDEATRTYDLWFVDQRGRQRRRITATAESETCVSCSPDGQQVVFTVGKESFISPLKKFQPRELHGSGHKARWTHDSDLIFLAVEHSDPKAERFWTEFWIANPDGDVLKKITGARFPSLSPDGKYIVYSRRGNLYREWIIAE